MISDDLKTAKSRMIDALRDMEREPKIGVTRIRELERIIGRLEALQHKMPAGI